MKKSLNKIFQLPIVRTQSIIEGILNTGPLVSGSVAYDIIFSTDSRIICTEASDITTDKITIATGSNLVRP